MVQFLAPDFIGTDAMWQDQAKQNRIEAISAVCTAIFKTRRNAAS
jgi:hypothetical protein